MNRLALLAVSLAALPACNKPLSRAIVGQWEQVCTTERASDSTCLGRDDGPLLTYDFRSDGTITTSARGGSTMRGEWKLAADELELVFEGGGLVLRERYDARIESGRLVLWYTAGEFGKVHVRAGTAPTFREGPSAKGGVVRHEISGMKYRLTLPGPYRLARDDNERQRWDPVSGEGFQVKLAVRPRSRVAVNGVFVTPPCEDEPPGISGSGGTIDGVDRDTSIGFTFCLDGTEKSFSCSVEHTRGWLESSDEEPALAICRSLAVESLSSSSK